MKGRKPSMKPSEQMELRLMREAGVPIKQAAAYFSVSETTALRTLARLRKKMGPEVFKGDRAHKSRQSARAHLFVNNATSQLPTSNTSDN